MRFRRRSAPARDLRGLACGDGPQADGRHRRDRNAAYLHRGPGGADPARRDGSAGARLRSRGARPDRAAGSRRHRRPARGARAHGLPLSPPTTGSAAMWRMAGTSRATAMSGMARVISGYQARSDDMIVSSGYKHRGTRGGELPAHTIPPWRNAAVVGQPDPERGMIVESLCGAEARPPELAGAGQGIAGFRQKRDSALQVSSRHRLRAVAAAHEHRQAPALRAEGGSRRTEAAGEEVGVVSAGDRQVSPAGGLATSPAATPTESSRAASCS